MRAVYKYTLVVTYIQEINLPVGAQILSVKEQRGRIVLYALVDPDETKEAPCVVRIYGTGHYIHAENLRFLGTVELHNGDPMFHVFVQEEGQ